MTRRNPFAFPIDYAKAIADDEALVALFADDGPVARAAKAAALLAPEHESVPEGDRRPHSNALDVFWLAALRGGEKRDEAFTLLGVAREDAQALVADAAVYDHHHAQREGRAPPAWTGVPFVLEAIARWGDDTAGREARVGEAGGRLLDVMLRAEDDRRRELRNARANLARHRKLLATKEVGAA